MLFVSVTGESGRTHQLVFHKDDITIGRIAGTDIVLPVGTVSKRHARVVVRDGQCMIADLRSSNGTFVNGQRIDTPLALQPFDKVGIGEFTLEVFLEDEDEVDTGEIDATELRLLAAVARRDEGSREVYADWLEEHGYPDRAELVRMGDRLFDMSPDAPEFGARIDRIRELARTIDMQWRYKVARHIGLDDAVMVAMAAP